MIVHSSELWEFVHEKRCYKHEDYSGQIIRPHAANDLSQLAPSKEAQAGDSFIKSVCLIVGFS